MRWYFFFFKQKTAYEMRISDWSSDVCSSDLQHEYVDSIEDAGRHLLSLLQDILDLSKIEAGREDLDESDVAIEEVVGKAIGRSEERRVGKACGSTCRSRWSPSH